MLALQGRAEDKLNLFIWSEYLPPEVARDFENRFQCKLVIDLYEDAESMLAKVQTGASGYDLIVPPDYLVPALAKQNLLAPIRAGKIPNLKNLDARFRNPLYDPQGRFAVPYQWGTIGIYMRKPDSGNLPEPSWSIIFDPSRQPGRIILIDSMRDLIGAALKYKGFSLNSNNPKELKPVRDLLLETKKRAAGFAGSVGAKNKVLDKSAAAAVVYSGEAARGMAEDPETIYLIPKEGSQIWVDNLTVLANAPHPELAEKFINYVLEPEIGAKISNFTQFATPNEAAKKLVQPELLKNPAIYPPEETLNRLEFLKDLGRDSRIYDQVWTEVKAR